MPDPQGQPITDTSTISAPKDNAATGLSHPLTAESISPSELLQVPGHVADAISHMSDSIENYTQEGRELHPVLAKLGDATREAKALLTGGQSAGKPMGTSSGVLNNPVTTAMSGADVAPEAGAAVESGLKKAADYITDRRAFAPNPETGHIVFDNLSSHLTHPEMDMAQGGHAGGGVASVEELNRPGRFVKVSRSGMPTDQGKVPDFNLKPGEAGYQVTPQGYELKAGQETPATKMGVDKYHKEVFKKPVPKAEIAPNVKSSINKEDLDSAAHDILGTKFNDLTDDEQKMIIDIRSSNPVSRPKAASKVIDIQGPPVENAGIIQNARKILRDPASTEEDKAIATRQLEHQHETRFDGGEDKAPQNAVEAAGGTYKGQNKDGLVEITLPRKMTEHLPISDRFKDFVSVTMPKGKVTEDSVRAAMTKKFSDMGGDPTMLSKALAKD